MFYSTVFIFRAQPQKSKVYIVLIAPSWWPTSSLQLLFSSNYLHIFTSFIIPATTQGHAHTHWVFLGPFLFFWGNLRTFSFKLWFISVSLTSADLWVASWTRPRGRERQRRSAAQSMMGESEIKRMKERRKEEDERRLKRDKQEGEEEEEEDEGEENGGKKVAAGEK